MASLRCARRTALSASQASQLPQFLRCSQNPGVCRVPLWERACSRWHRCGVPGGPRCLHRRQASSHSFLRCSQNPGVCRVPLWERACSRWHRCGASGGPRLLHRRQASSHRFCGAHKVRGSTASLCGSGLARDSSTSVIQIHRVARIASKPAPTDQSLRRLPPLPPRPQTTSYPAPGAAPESRYRPVPAAHPRPALPQRPESADVPCCDQRSIP